MLQLSVIYNSQTRHCPQSLVACGYEPAIINPTQLPNPFV